MNKKHFLLCLIFYFCAVNISKSQWVELGSGANALNANNYINAIAVDHQENVYAGGKFTNKNGNAYVAKWEGNSWTELGPGSSVIGQITEITAIALDVYGNVYATGFTRTSRNPFVAKWNGSSWSELDINLHKDDTGVISSMAFAPDGNLYVTGSLYEVYKYNGVQWQGLGSSDVFLGTLTTDKFSHVYVSGFNSDSLGGYVDKWDGQSWNRLRSGKSSDQQIQSVQALAVDDSLNVFAGGGIRDANHNPYVAKWNGSGWSELGTAMPADVGSRNITCLLVDDSSYLYAGGNFYDANLKTSIMQWNGSTWTELGHLQGNGEIIALAKDHDGNIYAAGWFSDASGNMYVAKYPRNGAVTGKTVPQKNDFTLEVFPNPVNEILNFVASEEGWIEIDNFLGQPVYCAAVGQGPVAVQLQNLRAGVYTLRFIGIHKNYTPVKVIKN